jgi:hypothetical protein
MLALAVGIATLYSMEAVRYCVRVFTWLPGHEKWARSTRGLCPTCGYELTGNVSGVCPECGATIGREVVDNKATIFPSLITERQPWWVWVLVAAMMTLALIVCRS